MAVEFFQLSASRYRILADGRRIGGIYRDPSLDFDGWVAEWRHFALEFETFEQARAYVEADLAG